jgi:LmbE family N-acetylglucosaminyl deacetylase
MTAIDDDGVRALGTILGVWAHPDDEAYLSGALMASAVKHGQRVVCVTATRGEAGFPDLGSMTADERAAIRVAELDACLAVLGVTEHQWLNYCDGQGDRVDVDEPVATLAGIIDAVQPDTVLTFGPDGMTGHVDHIAVSHWTTLAFRKAAPASARLLYTTKTEDWNEQFIAAVDPGRVMMVDGLVPPATEPDELALWFRADEELADVKLQALRCQASQIEPLLAQIDLDVFRDLNRDEFFRAPTSSEWTS